MIADWSAMRRQHEGPWSKEAHFDRRCVLSDCVVRRLQTSGLTLVVPRQPGGGLEFVTLF